MNFDETFWTERYRTGQIGWDAGEVTMPIKEYVDQLTNKDIKILVPGCGYGHEVKYLYDSGFTNVYVIDLSIEPLRALQLRCPNIPKDRFIQGDFLDLLGNYDLIIEQTFFSVFPPQDRDRYVDKMHSLLVPNGKLVGLLFNIPLNDTHPPFGGSREEYLQHFEPKFDLLTFETSHNSIPPRAGAEIFMILQKKGT